MMNWLLMTSSRYSYAIKSIVDSREARFMSQRYDYCKLSLEDILQQNGIRLFDHVHADAHEWLHQGQ